jgi:DNA-binding transcriptional LysR family regulator
MGGSGWIQITIEQFFAREDHHGATATVAASCDAALRIAHLPDSSMVAVRVGEVRRVIVAAPSYLAEHPRIDEPP